MKNKNKICCLFLLSLLSPTSVFATNTEIENTLSQIEDNMNLIQGKIGTLSKDISDLENDIKIYGNNYTYVYNSSSNSLNTNDSKSSYTITPNSIIQNNNSMIEDNSTISDILNAKNIEKSNLEKEYSKLEEMKTNINNFKKIEFDPEDVTKPSNLTVDEIQFILRGTKLYELAQDFYDAEEEYGVNSFFIISLCALESGWGTSSRAINDNNLTGFGVYSDSSKGINSATKRDNIMLTAKTIKNNYLTVGGVCYYGTSINSINIKYSASPTWASKITNIGNNLINDLNDNFLKSINFE